MIGTSHTNLLTVPLDSQARFLLTILLDVENNDSHGAVVAGVVRHLRAGVTVAG